MTENVADLTSQTENMSMYPSIPNSVFMPPPPSYYQELSALNIQMGPPTPTIFPSAPPTTPVAQTPPAPLTSNGNTVKLNVGGTVFQTAKSTLAKYDGLLKVMMMDPETPLDPIDGSIFIDRSAKHFDKILNYLRDGHVTLPESLEILEEIQKEAKYYMLDGLADNCELKMGKIEGKKNAFPEEVQVLNTHGELLQVIAEPQKPVLIIYYLVSPRGRIIPPQGFVIKSLVNKYQHAMNIYFRAFSDGVKYSTANPTEWGWSIHLRGGYIYDNPTTEKLARGGHLNVEPFQTQLEKAIKSFFNKNNIEF